jgi:hypothetical protein
VIALLLATLLVAQTQTQTPAQRPGQPAPRPLDVRIGTRVEPETVTVGDRFTLWVRVRTNAGATLQFPAGPDTLGAAELVTEPAISSPRGDTIWVEQIAAYRMAAWDIGVQPLRFSDVLVRRGDDERAAPLGGLTIFVRSVLPADTTLHVPKPPRPAFVFVFPWWLLWLLLAVLAALLAWWLWRRFRRREHQLPPFERAEREFARIEAMGLPDREQGARHVALMTDVAREYLVARLEPVLASHTSTELLAAAREAPGARWDPSVHARAERLLARADLAKFAALHVAPEEARTLGGEARSLVAETERRVTAPEEKAAA